MSKKKSFRAEDTPPLKLVVFNPHADSTPEEKLAEFIRHARDDLTVFGDNLDWSNWNWPGVGYFLKHGCSRKVSSPEELQHLHPKFMDFAKAYIRYQEGQNPSLCKTKSILQALRVIEHTLLLKGKEADPLDIDHTTLDKAAQTISEHLEAEGAYRAGRNMELLARFLGMHALTHNDTKTWRNPLSPGNRMGRMLGSEADEHRLNKLPDMVAINAIGEIFARGFDLADPTTHPDVYVTSAVGMLLSAPNRGGEIHELMTDLVVDDQKDSHGNLQYGWRFRSFKVSKGSDRIKWIAEPWWPIAKEALRRILEITEKPRAFARYVEEQLETRQKDPNAPLHFFRHANCPDVPDDQPLTVKQAAAALGSVAVHPSTHYLALKNKGLTTKNGDHTLNSLWLWVLEQLPPKFPYVAGAQNRDLKYSNALFCMHAFQLRKDFVANPVKLWMPSLSTLGPLLSGQSGVKSIFERHDVRGDEGKEILMTSHQPRHLLNTFAHSGTDDTFLDNEVINYWSGRDKMWQGTTYNHVPAENIAHNMDKALNRDGGIHNVIELPPSLAKKSLPQNSHWTVTRPGPKSCADIEIQHRSAVLFTIYGACEHDWMIEPCPYHKDCLNCKDHFCIKGTGKDDQERLVRIRDLLSKVIIQQELAKDAAERNKPGAGEWFEKQTGYRESLEQLIAILESPDVEDGAKIRFANPKANSHLHRVLRETVLRELENKSDEKGVVDALVIAFQENRALPLNAALPNQLGNRHG